MDKKILEMLNEKYGTNLNLRLEKLSEEKIIKGEIVPKKGGKQ